jgi:uncharacterized protein involved in exopolysaccharide biosynthesis
MSSTYDLLDPPLLTVRSVIALLAFRRRTILVAAVAAAFLVGVVLLVRPRTYTSSASFAPQARRSQGSALAGFAAQLGMGLPTADPTQSPAFYSDLAASSEILGPVVDSLRRSKLDGVSTIIDDDDKDLVHQKYRAILALRRAVHPSVQPKTGIVSLEVRARTPQLAERIGQLTLAELNRFNLTNRQTQAGAERRFTEQRLADVGASLRAAEDALSEFLRSNRGFLSAAELKMRESRLTREVDLRQSVYVSLAQQLEQARLDEVRDTPVLSIIEKPSRPVVPDSRRISFWTLLTAVVVSGLVAWWYIFRDLIWRSSPAPAYRSVTSRALEESLHG